MSILVTGKNGSLSRDMQAYFGNSLLGQKIFYLGREDLDLTNQSDVDNFFKSEKVEFVLHTAIKVGRRTHIDTYEDFYENLLMWHHLSPHIDTLKLFVNFDSSSSYDRTKEIHFLKERDVFRRLPRDFYGLAKNIICRSGLQRYSNFLNLRIFICFSENEADDRMVKGNILKYLKGDPLVIFQNRYMDFMYSYDILKVVSHALRNYKKFGNKDYNMCHEHKLTLLDVAQMINGLSNKSSQILVQNTGHALPVTGCHQKLAKLGLDFCGVQAGIKNVYEALKK